MFGQMVVDGTTPAAAKVASLTVVEQVVLDPAISMNR